MAFLAPAVYPTLSLRLLALWVFAAALLSGGPWGCVRVLLGQRSWPFFFFSSPPAQRGVGCCWASFWCCFCDSSCGACGFPRSDLQQVTLGGYATFLAPVACPAPAVELCCWVCGVLGVSLGFLPGVVLFLRGLRLALLPSRRLPLEGFCLSWHLLPALLLHWWHRLGDIPPFCFRLFGRQFHSALGSTCLLDLVSYHGYSVVSSCGSRLLCRLCGSLVALPCLRVGALLACGVYGASSLRSLQSRLHFVVSPPFLVSVCPSPALAVGWFGHM